MDARPCLADFFVHSRQLTDLLEAMTQLDASADSASLREKLDALESFFGKGSRSEDKMVSALCRAELTKMVALSIEQF